MAIKKKEITDKQKELLFYWYKFVKAAGYQPTQTEVARTLGVGRRAIRDRLTQLENKGFIIILNGQERATEIKLTEKAHRFLKEE